MRNLLIFMITIHFCLSSINWAADIPIPPGVADTDEFNSVTDPTKGATDAEVPLRPEVEDSKDMTSEEWLSEYEPPTYKPIKGMTPEFQRSFISKLKPEQQKKFWDEMSSYIDDYEEDYPERSEDNPLREVQDNLFFGLSHDLQKEVVKDMSEGDRLETFNKTEGQSERRQFFKLLSPESQAEVIKNPETKAKERIELMGALDEPQQRDLMKNLSESEVGDFLRDPSVRENHQLIRSLFERLPEEGRMSFFKGLFNKKDGRTRRAILEAFPEDTDIGRSLHEVKPPTTQDRLREKVKAQKTKREGERAAIHAFKEFKKGEEQAQQIAKMKDPAQRKQSFEVASPETQMAYIKSLSGNERIEFLTSAKAKTQRDYLQSLNKGERSDLFESLGSKAQKDLLHMLSSNDPSLGSELLSSLPPGDTRNDLINSFSVADILKTKDGGLARSFLEHHLAGKTPEEQAKWLEEEKLSSKGSEKLFAFLPPETQRDIFTHLSPQGQIDALLSLQLSDKDLLSVHAPFIESDERTASLFSGALSKDVEAQDLMEKALADHKREDPAAIDFFRSLSPETQAEVLKNPVFNHEGLRGGFFSYLDGEDQKKLVKTLGIDGVIEMAKNSPEDSDFHRELTDAYMKSMTESSPSSSSGNDIARALVSTLTPHEGAESDWFSKLGPKQQGEFFGFLSEDNQLAIYENPKYKNLRENLLKSLGRERGSKLLERIKNDTAHTLKEKRTQIAALEEEIAEQSKTEQESSPQKKDEWDDDVFEESKDLRDKRAKLKELQDEAEALERRGRDIESESRAIPMVDRKDMMARGEELQRRLASRTVKEPAADPSFGLQEKDFSKDSTASRDTRKNFAAGLTESLIKRRLKNWTDDEARKNLFKDLTPERQKAILQASDVDPELKALLTSEHGGPEAYIKMLDEESRKEAEFQRRKSDFQSKTAEGQQKFLEGMSSDEEREQLVRPQSLEEFMEALPERVKKEKFTQMEENFTDQSDTEQREWIATLEPVEIRNIEKTWSGDQLGPFVKALPLEDQIKFLSDDSMKDRWKTAYGKTANIDELREDIKQEHAFLTGDQTQRDKFTNKSYEDLEHAMQRWTTEEGKNTLFNMLPDKTRVRLLTSDALKTNDRVSLFESMPENDQRTLFESIPAEFQYEILHSDSISPENKTILRKKLGEMVAADEPRKKSIRSEIKELQDGREGKDPESLREIDDKIRNLNYELEDLDDRAQLLDGVRPPHRESQRAVDEFVSKFMGSDESQRQKTVHVMDIEDIEMIMSHESDEKFKKALFEHMTPEQQYFLLDSEQIPEEVKNNLIRLENGNLPNGGIDGYMEELNRQGLRTKFQKMTPEEQLAILNSKETTDDVRRQLISLESGEQPDGGIEGYRDKLNKEIATREEAAKRITRAAKGKLARNREMLAEGERFAEMKPSEQVEYVSKLSPEDIAKYVKGWKEGARESLFKGLSSEQKMKLLSSEGVTAELKSELVPEGDVDKYIGGLREEIAAEKITRAAKGKLARMDATTRRKIQGEGESFGKMEKSERVKFARKLPVDKIAEYIQGWKIGDRESLFESLSTEQKLKLLNSEGVPLELKSKLVPEGNVEKYVGGLKALQREKEIKLAEEEFARQKNEAEREKFIEGLKPEEIADYTRSWSEEARNSLFDNLSNEQKIKLLSSEDVSTEIRDGLVERAGGTNGREGYIKSLKRMEAIAKLERKTKGKKDNFASDEAESQRIEREGSGTEGDVRESVPEDSDEAKQARRRQAIKDLDRTQQEDSKEFWDKEYTREKKEKQEKTRSIREHEKQVRDNKRTAEEQRRKAVEEKEAREGGARRSRREVEREKLNDFISQRRKEQRAQSRPKVSEPAEAEERPEHLAIQEPTGEVDLATRDAGKPEREIPEAVASESEGEKFIKGEDGQRLVALFKKKAHKQQKEELEKLAPHEREALVGKLSNYELRRLLSSSGGVTGQIGVRNEVTDFQHSLLVAMSEDQRSGVIDALRKKKKNKLANMFEEVSQTIAHRELKNKFKNLYAADRGEFVKGLTNEQLAGMLSVPGGAIDEASFQKELLKKMSSVQREKLISFLKTKKNKKLASKLEEHLAAMAKPEKVKLPDFLQTKDKAKIEAIVEGMHTEITDLAGSGLAEGDASYQGHMKVLLDQFVDLTDFPRLDKIKAYKFLTNPELGEGVTNHIINKLFRGKNTTGTDFLNPEEKRMLFNVLRTENEKLTYFKNLSPEYQESVISERELTGKQKKAFFETLSEESSRRALAEKLGSSGIIEMLSTPNDLSSARDVVHGLIELLPNSDQVSLLKSDPKNFTPEMRKKLIRHLTENSRNLTPEQQSTVFGQLKNEEQRNKFFDSLSANEKHAILDSPSINPDQRRKLITRLTEDDLGGRNPKKISEYFHLLKENPDELKLFFEKLSPESQNDVLKRLATDPSDVERKLGKRMIESLFERGEGSRLSETVVRENFKKTGDSKFKMKLFEANSKAIISDPSIDDGDKVKLFSDATPEIQKEVVDHLSPLEFASLLRAADDSSSGIASRLKDLVASSTRKKLLELLHERLTSSSSDLTPADIASWLKAVGDETFSDGVLDGLNSNTAEQVSKAIQPDRISEVVPPEPETEVSAQREEVPHVAEKKVVPISSSDESILGQMERELKGLDDRSPTHSYDRELADLRETYLDGLESPEARDRASKLLEEGEARNKFFRATDPIKAFKSLSPENRAEVFTQMTAEERGTVLKKMSSGDRETLFESSSPEVKAKILLSDDIPEKTRKNLFAGLKPEERMTVAEHFTSEEATRLIQEKGGIEARSLFEALPADKRVSVYRSFEKDGTDATFMESLDPGEQARLTEQLIDSRPLDRVTSGEAPLKEAPKRRSEGPQRRSPSREQSKVGGNVSPENQRSPDEIQDRPSLDPEAEKARKARSISQEASEALRGKTEEQRSEERMSRIEDTEREMKLRREDYEREEKDRQQRRAAEEEHAQKIADKAPARRAAEQEAAQRESYLHDAVVQQQKDKAAREEKLRREGLKTKVETEEARHQAVLQERQRVEANRNKVRQIREEARAARGEKAERQRRFSEARGALETQQEKLTEGQRKRAASMDPSVERPVDHARWPPVSADSRAPVLDPAPQSRENPILAVDPNHLPEFQQESDQLLGRGNGILHQNPEESGNTSRAIVPYGNLEEKAEDQGDVPQEEKNEEEHPTEISVSPEQRDRLRAFGLTDDQITEKIEGRTPKEVERFLTMQSLEVHPDQAPRQAVIRARKEAKAAGRTLSADDIEEIKEKAIEEATSKFQKFQDLKEELVNPNSADDISEHDDRDFKDKNPDEQAEDIFRASTPEEKFKLYNSLSPEQKGEFLQAIHQRDLTTMLIQGLMSDKNPSTEAHDLAGEIFKAQDHAKRLNILQLEGLSDTSRGVLLDHLTPDEQTQILFSREFTKDVKAISFRNKLFSSLPLEQQIKIMKSKIFAKSFLKDERMNLFKSLPEEDKMTILVHDDLSNKIRKEYFETFPSDDKNRILLSANISESSRARLFKLLLPLDQAKLIQGMSSEQQISVFKELTVRQKAIILSYLDNNGKEDLRNSLFSSLSGEEREKVLKDKMGLERISLNDDIVSELDDIHKKKLVEEQRAQAPSASEEETERKNSVEPDTIVNEAEAEADRSAPNLEEARGESPKEKEFDVMTIKEQSDKLATMNDKRQRDGLFGPLSTEDKIKLLTTLHATDGRDSVAEELFASLHGAEKRKILTEPGLGEEFKSKLRKKTKFTFKDRMESISGEEPSEKPEGNMFSRKIDEFKAMSGTDRVNTIGMWGGLVAGLGNAVLQCFVNTDKKGNVDRQKCVQSVAMWAVTSFPMFMRGKGASLLNKFMLRDDLGITGVGRVILEGIMFAVSVAMVALDSMKVEQIIERAKLIDKIKVTSNDQQKIRKLIKRKADFYLAKLNKLLKSSNFTKVINVSDVIAAAEKGQKFCIDKHKRVDYSCKCRKNDSCLKFPHHLVPKTLSKSKSVHKTISLFNAIHSGKVAFNKTQKVTKGLINDLLHLAPRIEKYIKKKISKLPHHERMKKEKEFKEIDHMTSKIGRNISLKSSSKEAEKTKPFMTLFSPAFISKYLSKPGKAVDKNALWKSMEDVEATNAKHDYIFNNFGKIEKLVKRQSSGKWPHKEIARMQQKDDYTKKKYHYGSSIEHDQSESIWPIISSKYISIYFGGE